LTSARFDKQYFIPNFYKIIQQHVSFVKDRSHARKRKRNIKIVASSLEVSLIFPNFALRSNDLID
jgi:hypothetical protein